MTIARDQLSNLTASSPVAGTTFTITFPTNPAAGSSVIVALGINFNAAGSITSVVDNGTTPSTFTQDVTKTGTANHISYIYRADNITLPSSGGYVITVTVTVTGVSASAGAQSYTGKAAGGPVSTNTGTATSGTITTNNGTPTVGGSLFVGTFQNNSSNTADNVTVTNANFTARLSESNGSTAQVYGFADQIKVANTADACTWSVATATDTYSSAIAVYSPAATGPAAPFTPPRGVVRGQDAATKSRLSVLRPPPANPPAAPFQIPRKPVRGQPKTDSARNADSQRFPKAFVPPPTPSPFTPPRRPVRGQPKTDSARQNSSLGIPKPVVVPHAAAPFTPPRGVVRGQPHGPKGRNTSARAQVAVAPPPVVSAAGLVAAPIYDDFLITALNPQWSSFGTVTPGSGQLQLLATTSYSGITSVQQYDWTNTYALCKLAPYTGASSAQAFITLSASSNFNQVDFGYSQGNLIVQTWLGGVQSVPFTVAYNGTSHAWLRMRIDLQFIYFDTSPDGQVWTNRFQLDYVASHLVVWRMNLALAAGHFAAGTDGTAVFQHVNTDASIAGPVTVQAVSSNSVFTQVASVPAVGPRSVSPVNSQGNMLLVFATWNNQAVQFGVPMPAAAVGDDQGNWWRYIGDSGQLASGGRTGVWLCSNALAVENWLSFCPQGYCGSFAFQVVELTGLPASYYPNLDFHVAYGAGAASVSNPSISGTTVNPSYVFVALGGQYTSGTVSGPTGSAWTSIGTVHSSGNDLTGDATCRLDTWWGTFAANTPLTAGWTVGGTFVGAASAVMVGVTVNSSLPPQSRPTFPRVVVEGGFGTLPGDPTLAVLDDQWTDLSQFCIGKQGETAISAQRGQQYELATPESGQLMIACNNQAGDFNPQWAGSQLYSNAINSDMSMQIVGTANWAQHGGTGTFFMSEDFTFVSSSVPGSYANESLKYLPSSTSTLSYEFTDDTGADLVLNPNYQYTMSVWIYSPGGWAGGVKWSFITRNSAGSLIWNSETLGTVPAGQWVQLTATANPGAVEAGTVVLGYLDFNGSPTPANPFYLAEVAIVAGTSPVQTGLVRLNVPVRASAFWDGRRYPIGFGYVERWPQDWPDWPQWGWSKLIATDVVGVANSVNLPSAVQGEILVDQPYACFPFNEQYAASSGSGTSGGAVQKAQLLGVDGMFAVNTSPVNQRPAIYVDGFSTPCATGQSIGLLGDSGTGMGNATDSAPNGTFQNGPGAIYGPDFGIPVTNVGSGNWFTVDFWINQTDLSSPVPTTVSTRLLDIVCQQNLTEFSIGNGVLATVGVQYVALNSTAELFIETNSTALTLIPFGEMHVNSVVIDGATFQVPSNLVTVASNGSQIGIYLNGQFLGLWSYANPLSAPVAFAFGQSCYTTSQLLGTVTYSMSYASYYPLTMPLWRIQAHAQAGLSGFALDGLTDRALRYVAWAKLNLGLIGAQDTASSLGPAYSTAGSSLANALNADCTSFGGRWQGNANGNLVLQSRQSQYNLTTSTVFGDTPAGILNSNPGFNRNLSGWTASGCAANLVNIGGIQSVQLTFSGGTNPTFIGDFVPVTAGTWYEMETWVRSPEGWGGGVSVTVSWYSGSTLLSTSALTAYPETATWVPAVLTAQAPPSATQAKFGIQVNGTPPVGPSILVRQAPVRLAFDDITYEPDQAFDYDNTYVVNDIQAQMTEGPVTTSAPEIQDQTAIKKYFRRGPQSVQMSGTTAGSAYDLANWRMQNYKDPSMRVRQIEARPSSAPATFTRIFQNDVSDLAVMRRGPLNPTLYDMPVINQRVEHTIGAGTWSVSYQLSPYTAQGSALQADAPGFNVIANNNLAW